MPQKKSNKVSKKSISDADKKYMISHFKRGRKVDSVCEKFPKYTRYQIGAVLQHVTKGDYQ